MDTLPRHLQLKLFKGVDTLRALGVRPGRIVVPGSLRAGLERWMRSHDASVFLGARAGSRRWYVRVTHLVIPDTEKRYLLYRSSKDGPLLDCTVFLADDACVHHWSVRGMHAVHGMHVLSIE